MKFINDLNKLNLNKINVLPAHNPLINICDKEKQMPEATVKKYLTVRAARPFPSEKKEVNHKTIDGFDWRFQNNFMRYDFTNPVRGGIFSALKE
jgi:hypothetical protein